VRVETERNLPASRGRFVDPKDRAGYLLATILLLIILGSGAVDIGRGDWRGVTVEGILGVAVAVAILTLSRLPR